MKRIIIALALAASASFAAETNRFEFVTVDRAGRLHGTSMLVSPEFNARVSHTNPSFSAEVLAVQVDTNLVAQIGELKQFFDELPAGTVGTSLGGLVVVLLMAAAWLKRNKADKDTLFSKYAQANAYSVGDLVLKDGTVYKCKTAVAAGSAWDATKWETSGIDVDDFAKDFLGKQVAINALKIPLEAKTDSFAAEDGHAYAVTMTGTVTITMPTATENKAAIFQARFSAAAQQSVQFDTDDVVKFDGADCGIVKAGKDALLSAMWNGEAWDLVWKNEA